MESAVRRGNPENLLTVWNRADRWDIQEGIVYYSNQQVRMEDRVRAYYPRFTLTQVSAAFAALSPNNAESTNYVALDLCLRIAAQELPDTTKVPAYGKNKTKALAILRGEPIDLHLRGQKVRSFHANTIDPCMSEEVTVDGHMLGAWIGKRLVLRREAEIHAREYPVIRDDFRIAASRVGLRVTGFQAIIWLTWKRIHGILRPPQIRMDFPFHETIEVK